MSSETETIERADNRYVSPRISGHMRNWLQQAVRQFQVVADVQPVSCSDLYDSLADLVDSTPPPRNQLDIVCARYLMQNACIGIAASKSRESFGGTDASLGWASVWNALTLIGNEHWPRLADELRTLARRHRTVQSLPQRVATHLRLHFVQACRLPDVARSACASPRAMTEAFKAEYRCTVHEYISLLRLRAAVRLLMESDMKISAICGSVGWNSQADLYRHLRRFTTLGPTAVRSNQAGASQVLNTLDEWLASHGLPK